jgi:hypothetical protein
MMFIQFTVGDDFFLIDLYYIAYENEDISSMLLFVAQQ